ncbi:putative membrane protein [Motilibacter rhizosphaerae]|uniref:Putative membrane protein n=1 Tax=Motilibacter rhizosphaerae TaxID=598652 RepID=A0A4Q7NGU8_9ACTN|nr:carotenoid biosynthesis protein [Motilibacter rhizosphaerae]RZS82938.1 putative membrane protein [Motilibacter rhizosphaerae]
MRDALLRPALLLAAATVLCQVAYPLTSGAARDRLTVATVLVAALAVLLDLASSRGPLAAARAAAATWVLTFAVEAVGTGTGQPFGPYSYAGSLGPRVLGVPLLVPLAWGMVALPLLMAVRRLAASPAARAALGGVALTGWDLFLDPQMVAAGHWRWADPSPHLPGVPHVPVHNFAGWLVTGTVLVLVLDRVVPEGPADPLVPAVLLGWTWLGGVVGAAAFFGRPAVAVWGGVVLGAVVVPWLVLVARDAAVPQREPVPA